MGQIYLRSHSNPKIKLPLIANSITESKYEIYNIIENEELSNADELFL